MLEDLSTIGLLVIFFAALLGFGLVRSLLRDRREMNEDSQAAEESGADPEGCDAEWFEVLGVDPTSSLEDIRFAYKRKLAKYHPDKVASLGEEFMVVAERMTKRINSAYEKAIKRKL